ncbi:MAG: divergent polysaccharide deacetylase family protein [Rickettsiales bacterium]|jgi:polysaccharide deacetylase 2 family uncharacterized protein YibQ|nr:divergent polysaccharide deacetylase family protein [Rickettsiales bacterium]
MKKFSRLNKSSYSVFTIFIFLLIFSIFIGATFYFINSIINNEIVNDIAYEENNIVEDSIKSPNKHHESEKIAEKITDKFTIENLPSISILVAGLGLDKEIVDRALLRLPKSISLGFVPYASHFDYPDINDRDLLMNIPMETYDYFFKDNGPYSLICKLGVDNNSKRLEYIISKSNDFNGYYTEMDESFTDDIRDLNFLLKRISETNKHILYNDPKEIKSFRDVAIKFGMKDRILRVDSVINQKMSEIELIKRLDDLKLIASARGHAIVIINASINNIDILEKWIKIVAKSLKYNIITIDELRGKVIKREVTK